MPRGEFLHLRQILDQTELIPQPFDGGGGKIDEPLQRIRGLAAQHPRQRGDRAVARRP